MTTESKFLLYKTDNHDVSINVLVSDETIWATQKNIADLFGVSVSAINKHLTNIYESGELDKNRTISKMEIVQTEGTRTVSRKTTFYNLDAIISVGYRVNSIQATHFRQWATQTLKEYMIKGFVMDDDRLKQGTNLSDKKAPAICRCFFVYGT